MCLGYDITKVSYAANILQHKIKPTISFNPVNGTRAQKTQDFYLEMKVFVLKQCKARQSGLHTRASQQHDALTEHPLVFVLKQCKVDCTHVLHNSMMHLQNIH
jgi:hypothetical protein